MICTIIAAIGWGLICRTEFPAEERTFPCVAGSIIIAGVCMLVGAP